MAGVIPVLFLRPTAFMKATIAGGKGIFGMTSEEGAILSKNKALSAKGLKNLQRYRDIIVDFDAFLETVRRPLPKCIWLHPERWSLERILQQEGWSSKSLVPLSWRKQAYRLALPLPLGGALTHTLGCFHIQEEVSMTPAALLKPRPGEKILDLCAAPGNKTAEIALAMKNTGTVIANDRSPQRLKSLRSTLSRLGICNVSTQVSDGLRLGWPENFFDAVLADVPCSCEGTLRKSPSVMDHDMKSMVPLAAGLQIGLLQKAVTLCKPGGRVLYSTCTFRPEENEMVVDAILKRNQVRLVEVSLPGLKFSPGIRSWGSLSFQPDMEKCARIWPHQNNSGGFFLALLVKGTS